MEYEKFINEDPDFDNLFKCMDILPKGIFKDSDYFEELKNCYEEYKLNLERVNFNSIDGINIRINISRINKICEIILSAIEYQLNGNLVDAISKTKELFATKDIGHDLYTYILDPNEEIGASKQLYRGRVSENINKLGEMFHVPFNKREYVKTERYSIPGYPCLYLSGSIYGSWLELRKPSVKNFFVSRYEITKRTRVLDLSVLPGDLFSGNIGNGSEFSERIRNGEQVEVGEIIERYIYTWPILCACSFFVETKDRSFKSEYILPQLLLQVIRNINSDDGSNYLSGIKYCSVQCKYNSNVRVDPIYANYVFISDNKPFYSDEAKNQYSDKLKKQFKLTPPVNFYLITTTKMDRIYSLKTQGHNRARSKEIQLPNVEMDILRRKAFIETIKGYYSQYFETDFYNLEEILCKIPAIDLDESE